MYFGVQPLCHRLASQDHRHPIVNLIHELVCSSGQDRERAALTRCAGPPSLPNSGEAHDGIVSEVNLERPLFVGLPLEESAQRHDATLASNQFTEQAALEHRLALGVDGRELRRECRLESRNELPAHLLELTLAINEAKDQRVLCRAKVVDGCEVEQLERAFGQILEIEFLF